MDIDKNLLAYYRSRGYVPDRYWYQLNGQDMMQNWREQHEAIYARFLKKKEEAVPQFIFTSEVKIK